MRKKLLEILFEMLDRKLISKQNLEYLRPPSNARPRLFYTLPKIHKPQTDWRVPFKIPKGRPIVSDVGSISYKISEFITHVLTQFSTQHPSFIKDTGDFINKITNIHIAPHAILAIMDVESLYTNIDNTLGLKFVEEVLSTSPTLSSSLYTPTPKNYP